MSSYLVDSANISWDAGSPVSDLYNDIYWQRGSPLPEKNAVFVQPLMSLVQQPDSKTQVTVAELGFGFGVNCLLTAKAWQNMPGDCQLNYVSIEKHPVAPSELERLLKDLDLPHTQALLDQYPPPYRGQHVIWLAANIRLVLIFDEAETALANLDADVDCWYLDGFAPARNEAMWQASLYRKIFARSRAGAIINTYSSAGFVRRGLEDAGFQSEKRPGYGNKREMISASKPGAWQIAPHGRTKVSIVGAGIAGLFCLEALKRRGVDHQIFDSGIAGPSSIPQLSVLPQLAKAPETRYRFSLAACQFMQKAPGFHGTGLHWRGRTEEETIRLQAVAKQFPESIIEAKSDGAWFPKAGWLSFSELSAALNPEIIKTHVDTINELLPSGHVILATGFNRSLLPEQLQVNAIRGQAVEIETRNIQHVINGRVTIFPTLNGKSVVSGTYEKVDHDQISEADTQHLIKTAAEYIEVSDRNAKPWTGIRAVARDRLPIVGQAPDWQAAMAVNRISALRDYQPHLHFCTAFASRGATHARLCAEHTVSKLLGEPAALGLEEQYLLSPARFVIRDNNAAG